MKKAPPFEWRRIVEHANERRTKAAFTTAVLLHESGRAGSFGDPKISESEEHTP
jgi:hypothetical protein